MASLFKKTHCWWWLRSYYCFSVKETDKMRGCENKHGAHGLQSSSTMQLEEKARKVEGDWCNEREQAKWIISINQGPISSGNKALKTPLFIQKHTAHLRVLATPCGGAGGTYHPTQSLSQNCFKRVTVAKEKEAYLDVTGEDDLLEMLLRGDMRLQLSLDSNSVHTCSIEPGRWTIIIIRAWEHIRNVTCWVSLYSYWIKFIGSGVPFFILKSSSGHSYAC